MTLAGGDPFERITNNTQITLLTPIAGGGARGAYPIVIECSTNIPADWPASGWATVDQEIFHYSGKVGATLTGCYGGEQDTAEIAHAAGAYVGLYITRDSYWPLQDAASGLAVYKDSVVAALTFGIKPGWLKCGNGSYFYAGAVGIAVGGPATTYVSAHVNAAGTVTINLSVAGFGDYYPLAIVTSDATTVTAIEDCRPRGSDPGNQEFALYTVRDGYETAGVIIPPAIPAIDTIYFQKLYFDGPNIKNIGEYSVGLMASGAPAGGLISLALYYSDDGGATMTFLAASNVDSIGLDLFPTGLVIGTLGALVASRTDRWNFRQWFLALQGDAAAVGAGYTFAGYSGVNTLLAPLALPDIMYPVFSEGAPHGGGIVTWPTPINPIVSQSLFWGKVT